MKKILALIGLSLVISQGFSQDDVSVTFDNFSADDAASHVWVLASDEFQGRDTGTPGIDLAAAYIASRFRQFGMQPLPGHTDFYQQFHLEKTKPPILGSIDVDDLHFSLVAKNFLIMSHAEMEIEAPVYFTEWGMPDDLNPKKVEGKIVIVRTGNADSDNARQHLQLMSEKRKAAKENGAVALIELYNSPSIPWDRLAAYYSRERISLPSADKGIPHIWLHDNGNQMFDKVSSKSKLTGHLKLGNSQAEKIPVKNVVGMIPGTDPELKDQYVILTAHYDHVGVQTGSQAEDTIYNGARDNAVGVAAIMAAGQNLALNPARRSVIVLACTAEEKGLLGSRYFAENSPIELNKIVFNMNIDGGGYNDTTKFSVIGLHRTTAEEQIASSIRDAGLEPFADPAPEQNLFDRSDNVNFAVKGIPSPSLSMGFTAFDDNILKYYHQLADNPESLDYDYLEKFFKAFVLAVRRVSDMDETPFWVEGDKYEPAGRELYGLDNEE